MQKCTSCSYLQLYPRGICGQCGSQELGWQRSSGLGVVFSYTVVWRPPSAAFVPKVPYVVAIVELDEGPHLMSNIINCPPESVLVGMRVQVLFEVGNDNLTLPMFEPLEP